MRSVIGRSVVLLALLAFLVSCPIASAQGSRSSDGTGILLVAFGTTVPQARAAYDAFDAAVRAAFPDVTVRWAYTSHKVRKIVAEDGLRMLSVPEALEAMRAEGVQKLAVQSLHVIPGREYHDKLLQSVLRFRREGGFKAVALGDPLLSTHHDMETVADALLASVPAERGARDAVVFMGHGTHHPANIYYPGLQWYLSRRDSRAFVGTVEGAPDLDWVVNEVRATGAEKVWLVPLMTVAGDHARNDMAGDEPDSWKSRFAAEGIAVEPVLRGMGEGADFRAVWLDHLRNAMQRLK